MMGNVECRCRSYGNGIVDLINTIVRIRFNINVCFIRVSQRIRGKKQQLINITSKFYKFMLILGGNIRLLEKDYLFIRLYSIMHWD